MARCTLRMQALGGKAGEGSMARMRRQLQPLVDSVADRIRCHDHMSNRTILTPVTSGDRYPYWRYILLEFW
jgi:hypothetical protein